MGDEEGLDVGLLVPEIGDVGDDEIDAEHLLVGEHQAAVDDDDVVAVLEDEHVLADLAHPAERDDPEGRAGRRWGVLSRHGGAGVAPKKGGAGDDPPHGVAAEGHDEGRVEGLELALQVGQTGGELVRLGVAVVGRPALHDARDEDFLTAPGDRGQEADQEVPGPTDERSPLAVLVEAGTLADEDDLRVRVALTRDGVGAPGVEATTGAGADLRGDGLQRRRARGRRGRRGLERLRERGRGHAGAPTGPARRDRARIQSRPTSASAISTAFVAAPFRRLSETTHRPSPRSPSTDGAWRTRPTKISSRPAAFVASGYSCLAGSSWTTTPGTVANRARAASGVMGRVVWTWTASEWLTNTRIRTAVHERRSSGRWRILRLSATTFHSSFVYPFSRKTSISG